MKMLTLGSAKVVLAASLATAQDEAREPQRKDSRPEIKVLQHPYDIASFYRSSGRSSWGFVSEPIYGYGTGSWEERYPIASFYRQGGASHNPFGYSRFWSQGYEQPISGPRFGYRRTIGSNGDVLLMVPTVLAPFGPIAESFSPER
jgi:hypothetical protein